MYFRQYMTFTKSPSNKICKNARAAIFELKYSFSEGATFALRLMKKDI